MAATDNTRQQAWLLSKLMQAEEAELEDYRARRLEREDVSLDDLRTLKACLTELSRALLVNMPARWKAVRDAAKALGAVALDGEATIGLTAARPATAALPFSGSRPAPPMAVSPLEPSLGFGSTAPLKGNPPAGAALPFEDDDGEEPAVEVDKLSLTLGHHAELTAARARDPNGWEAVLLRYGIGDAESFGALDRAWQARFKERPELQRRWVAAYRRAQKSSNHDH